MSAAVVGLRAGDGAAAGFEVRPYAVGDEAAIVSMFRAAFGREISAAHWRWKLQGCPGSLQNVWLAFHDGTLVFHYAAIETRFQIAGAATSVMLSVDTMTKPGYRRKGMLTEIAGQVFDTWRGQGAAFVLGLPNQQWGSRVAAFGGDVLFPFQWLVRPLRPERLLARRWGVAALRRLRLAGTLCDMWWRRRSAPDPALEVQPALAADACFDSLWERCRGEASFRAVHDRRWVQWRYFDCPSRAYRLSMVRH